jgi:hypothetical protein
LRYIFPLTDQIPIRASGKIFCDAFWGCMKRRLLAGTVALAVLAAKRLHLICRHWLRRRHVRQPLIT